LEGVTFYQIASIIIFILGIIGGVIGIVTFTTSKTDKAKKEGEQTGIINTKLDNLKSILSEIPKTCQRHDEEISQVEQRVCVVEESTKSAHKRIDELKMKVG